MIALPGLGASLVCKLIHVHPQIFSVALLADLQDEKSYRDKYQRKPRERVVSCR
jgi:hypothetical protein